MITRGQVFCGYHLRNDIRLDVRFQSKASLRVSANVPAS